MTVTSTDFGDNAGPTLNKTVDVVGGVEKVPTYDANGNMDSVYEPATGQTTTYRYDAEDRLVQIVKAGTTYTLGYDGFSRMRTLSDGTTTKTFMWLGLKLAEERNATGATVAKEFFGLGVRDNGVNKYYTRDHLGSIRELMAADGTTVLARYDYDPYGRRVKVAGSDDADFGFTGHYYHAPSGLHLAPFRAYDADLGRWLNRDPIGEVGGVNLYGYVGGDPINWTDPLGLDVSVGHHTVTGTIYQHTFIKITPENQGKYNDPDLWIPDENGVKSLTLGAGPKKNKLVSDPNRDTDTAPHKPWQYSPVGLPSDCANEDEFIARLLKQDANYDDDLEYDAAANPPQDRKWYLADDGYNSNSYVAGMLKAAGATPPEFQYYKMPGYDKPVPPEEFK